MGEAGPAQCRGQGPGEERADGDALTGPPIQQAELAIGPEAAIGAIHLVEQVGHRLSATSHVAALEDQPHCRAERSPGRVPAHLTTPRWSHGRSRSKTR